MRENHAHLELSGVVVGGGANQVAHFTQADIDLGLVRVVADDAAYAGTADVTLSVSDNVAGSTPATATVDETIFNFLQTVLIPAGFSADNNNEDVGLEIGSGVVQPGGSGTSFTVVNSAVAVIRDFVFTGTGFVYGSNGSAITIIGGTITSILVLTHGAQQQLVSFAGNMSAADFYNAAVGQAAGGNNAFDALFPNGSTQNSIGGPGPDVLGAGDGNDRLQGNGGNDVLDGGGGLDRASYTNATGLIVVQLAAGTVTGDASIGTDRLLSVEFIVGTDFADTYNAIGLVRPAPTPEALARSTNSKGAAATTSSQATATPGFPTVRRHRG